MLITPLKTIRLLPAFVEQSRILLEPGAELVVNADTLISGGGLSTGNSNHVLDCTVINTQMDSKRFN